MRKKNILKSAVVGLLEELVAIISGFILPRMILTHFGSSYNGIIAAVTQFIGCIALLKSGIGMATKAALYEPLHGKDQNKINGIMSATMKFLRKVAIVFVIGIIVFASVYPFVVKDEFSWYFTFTLVLIISLGTFFQYYFGLGNQLLLEADQKYYIVALISIINIVFNTLISVICMQLGMSIHGVKLWSSIVYCTTPIILFCYVRKTYNLNTKVEPDWNSISKRWDAFGMQIANFVNNNTDIIVASLFLNIREVSVYTIYYLAINGIKKITTRITTGVEAALGSMVAAKDKNVLRTNFVLFEYVLNIICVFMFSCLLVLIVPFVTLYTKGVTDVEYSRQAFATIACFAELFYCLRLAYTYLVQATGMFSETKKYYYIEAIINIVSSVILVNILGLVGIVIGTLMAMIFRTVVFAHFAYKEILEIPVRSFYKRMFVTVLSVVLNFLAGTFITNTFAISSFASFFINACGVGSVIIFVTGIVHFICYQNLTCNTLKKIIWRLKK